jgi:hypothetical protein
MSLRTVFTLDVTIGMLLSMNGAARVTKKPAILPATHGGSADELSLPSQES